MRRPENITVTESAWKEAILAIVNRSLVLLDSSEKLLSNNGDKTVCAGLYTYAVEEYGKFLFLKSCQPINGKVEICYKNEFCNHPKKFGEAIKALPSECTALHRGIFTEEIFIGDSQVFDAEIISDFEARTAIFYTDFNNKGDGLAVIPSITPARLKTAITTLRKIINETSIQK